MSPRKINKTLTLISGENWPVFFLKPPQCGTSPVSSRATPVVTYLGQNMPRSRSTFVTGSNAVRQRILSARRLRSKEHQNQVSEMQKIIHDMAEEIRTLRFVVQRQSKALLAYESYNAELPKILHKHAEEVRCMKVKNQKLNSLNRDYEQQLKKKDAKLIEMGDQIKVYKELIQNKSLETRQRLTDKLKAMQLQMEEKENDVRTLARRLQLEMKQSNQQQVIADKKCKDLTVQVHRLRNDLTKYKQVCELYPTKVSARSNHKTTDAKATPTPDVRCQIDSTSCIEPSEGIKSLLSSLKRTTFNEYLKFQIAKFNAKKVAQNNKSAGDNNGCVLPQLLATPAVTANSKSASPRQESLKLPLATGPLDLLVNDTQELGSQTDSSALSSSSYASTVKENKRDALTSKHADCQVPTLMASDNEASTIKPINSNSKISRVEIPIEPLPQIAYVEPITENMLLGNSENMADGNLGSMRKQIVIEGKTREAFLNIFVRPASSIQGEIIEPQQRNSIGSCVPSVRKHKLLAALKAIDDNKSLD